MSSNTTSGWTESKTTNQGDLQMKDRFIEIRIIDLLQRRKPNLCGEL